MNWRILLGSLLIAGLITAVLSVPFLLPYFDEDTMHSEASGGDRERSVNDEYYSPEDAQSSFETMLLFLLIGYLVLTTFIYVTITQYKKRTKKTYNSTKK